MVRFLVDCRFSGRAATMCVYKICFAFQVVVWHAAHGDDFASSDSIDMCAWLRRELSRHWELKERGTFGKEMQAIRILGCLEHVIISQVLAGLNLQHIRKHEWSSRIRGPQFSNFARVYGLVADLCLLKVGRTTIHTRYLHTYLYTYIYIYVYRYRLWTHHELMN